MDTKMSTDAPRQKGVWRQTRALFYKNCLVKWRTKKSSVQEILLPLFFLFWLILLSMMYPNKKYDEVPDSDLYSVDHSIISEFVVGYTPVNNVTRKIMHKMSAEYFTEGITTEEFLTEQEMQEATFRSPQNFVGVIFKDSMSYQLRFPPTKVPVSAIHVESRASCPNPSKICEAETYWRYGFTALQICIDAAIIQLKTNHSILEELEQTKAVMMGESAILEIDNFPRAIILIYLVIAFSPFGYYLAIHIVAEKEKKLKEFLMIMGLHDTAFWLSWVLLYTSLIFVMSLLMSVIATFSSLFPKSSSFVIFLLFFLYGISSVFFAFMLTPLFKKSKHVGTVEFLSTLAFGIVGLTIFLVEDIPKSFVWLVSPLCQCTFLIGVAQVMHLEDYEEGVNFSNLTYGPYPLIVSILLLALDSMLYLLLAVYLDQVIPGEYGLRRHFFFFLKPSFWSKRTKNYKELYESNINGNLDFNEIIEPVSAEFQGKEAIRINCVQKSFVKKGETVEALKDLSFDIYEGQITALLGHSGTGKTTLMNILCGLCPPSDVIAFSPFGYYLAIHIVAEKEKKLKEFLMIMGLHDTAFWLSWVLLYTSLIFVMSLLMSVIATFSSLFPKSSSFVIFLLFFLYGISSVFFAFMLTPLFKKSKHVGTVEFLSTLAFGIVGLTIFLVEDIPKSFVWLVSPLCQCTFLIGVAQVMHLEDYEEGVNFSNLTYGPYPLIVSILLLALDSMLYLLLAVYLDQVIPGEYGLRRHFFFFLKPSFWSKRTKNYKELYESNINGNLDFNEIIEPVSAEFQGKEAIRINCVQKSFVKKGETVEALKDLSFDIYEGQITALLGHSGTGKTTLMNILCGLCPPSDGFASIYGYRVSEIDEMLDARKITGVCQQMDVYFDVLTVEENLSILAAVKGIPPNYVIQEVQKVLLDLDMQPIKDNQAKKLSGGQKRKLSIGIAILGDPKVLLLDEPTAGMDPCSRHTVWNLLKNRKANHVTVFSTHFMDEADILADRKAVISQGMLKCLGSSLFLKTKWGIGYRLSMHIDRYCNTEATASVIRQHIPGSSLLKQNEEQMIYALPFKDMDKFSALFADLDTHAHLGVISYGVSMTTLEDVFLKLEAEAEIDQADFSVFNSENVEEEMDTKSTDELEQSLLMLSEVKSCVVNRKSLWKKQVATMAKVHFLNLKREVKSVTVVFLLFTVFLVIQIFMFVVHHYFKKAVVPIQLSPNLYFLKTNETYDKYKTSLLIQNSTGSDIDDLLSALRNQNILTEVRSDSDYESADFHSTALNSSGYVSLAPHSAALNVFKVDKSYIFTAAFNRTMIHSLPVMMNIISNFYLYSSNITEKIQVWSNPFFQEITDTVFTLVLYFEAVLLGVLVTGMPSYFAMENAENHKTRAYTQLKISGLYPSAYWCGQALIDIPLFYIILLLMVGSLFVFHHGVYFFPEKFLAVVFCLIGYVPSVVMFNYIVSFSFNAIQNTKEFWSFIFSVAALVCSVVIEVAFFMWYYTTAAVLHVCFSIFVPIYPLIGCLISFIKIVRKLDNKMEKHSERLLISVVAPYLQCVVWLFLLRYLEMKCGGKSVRKDPFFRTPMKPKPWKLPDVPHDENEDEDVTAERLRVKELITCQSCEEKPAVLVHCLQKEYNEKGDFLLGRKIKKVATNRVSFCVKKGEILGVLGPNGAGKSTLINILVGEVEPNSGQVLMGDFRSDDNEDDSMRFVGYCPQTNPLWPEITLQEHFEIYGAIKGMNESDLKEVIKCISSALDFKEQLQKKVKKLGAGIKRKLCFALSMLGSPHITLLDEPSTGMDPKAKQHMWKAIRAALKSKKRAAILTTHYMEEAEAVCDRVAILVSGKLRCIGTVQHLKTKFGKGYFLEMKLKEVPDLQMREHLQRAVLRIFPNGRPQESFSSISSYKIPKEDVHSLALSFSKLEEAKHAFNIEEYSFSQATLEQVFVELAKEQEEDDSFGTLNSTLWWERTQGERVVF